MVPCYKPIIKWRTMKAVCRISRWLKKWEKELSGRSTRSVGKRTTRSTLWRRCGWWEWSRSKRKTLLIKFVFWPLSMTTTSSNSSKPSTKTSPGISVSSWSSPREGTSWELSTRTSNPRIGSRRAKFGRLLSISQGVWSLSTTKKFYTGTSKLPIFLLAQKGPISWAISTSPRFSRRDLPTPKRERLTTRVQKCGTISRTIWKAIFGP